MNNVTKIQTESKMIERGDWVFVVPKSDHCWLNNFYSGEIQSVDDEAIRLTLMDWIVGMPVGADVYVRKSDIAMMFIFGRDHHKETFGQEVEKWERLVKKNNPK
ncbi:MAG: hypothetical protein OXI60_00865 [Acidiferrobacterales bacterium]|nr:hypothetical protein [Acidiferrobacterales bacterium]